MQSFNIIGTYTLYMKEVRRFLKVYNQTLFAPVITALLFLAIFNLALGDRVKMIGDVPFPHFMAAGLIIMSSIQNAFANSSSSIIMGKVMGTIIDYLMPPLSAAEIVFSFVMAAITRAILVAIFVGIAVWWFIDFTIIHHWVLLFYLFAASMLLGLLGVFAGIIAETFDQMSAVTSYVITPLAFLSGTFYSVHQLPPFWYQVSQWNPFFYMIDGFRYGMTGYHDSHIGTGMVIMIVCNILLWATVQTMLTRGYRIKH